MKDEPAGRGEGPQEWTGQRPFPRQIDIARVIKTPGKVDRSLTRDLICDVSAVWCSCVPGVTDLHDLMTEAI